jgi:hypothetical protein
VGGLAGIGRWTDAPMAALIPLLGAHQMIESVVWRGEEGTVWPAAASAA